MRSSSGTSTVTTPSVEATRSSRLWFGPRTSRWASDGLRERIASSSCSSLASATSTVTGGPGSAAASASRSSAESRRPLTQRLPPTVRSRVRTPSTASRIRAGQGDLLDAHAWRSFRVGRDGRARIRSHAACRRPPCAFDSPDRRGYRRSRSIRRWRARRPRRWRPVSRRSPTAPTRRARDTPRQRRR